MKKLLFTAIAATATATVSYGQGDVFVDNTANTGVYSGAGGTALNPVYSAAVTQNGLIFTTDVAAQQGGGSALIGVDFSFALYAGATQAALQTAITAGTPLDSATGASTVGVNAVYGGVQDTGGFPFVVPGAAAGSTVYLDLVVWEGTTYTTDRKSVV